MSFIVESQDFMISSHTTKAKVVRQVVIGYDCVWWWKIISSRKKVYVDFVDINLHNFLQALFVFFCGKIIKSIITNKKLVSKKLKIRQVSVDLRYLLPSRILNTHFSSSQIFNFKLRLKCVWDEKNLFLWCVHHTSLLCHHDRERSINIIWNNSIIFPFPASKKIISHLTKFTSDDWRHRSLGSRKLRKETIFIAT